jgi:hypothetical protein
MKYSLLAIMLFAAFLSCTPDSPSETSELIPSRYDTCRIALLRQGTDTVISIAWNERGQLVEGGNRRYEYDMNNRIIRSYHPTQKNEVFFSYDNQGRLVGATHVRDHSGTSAPDTTYYEFEYEWWEKKPRKRHMYYDERNGGKAVCQTYQFMYNTSGDIVNAILFLSNGQRVQEITYYHDTTKNFLGSLSIADGCTNDINAGWFDYLVSPWNEHNILSATSVSYGGWPVSDEVITYKYFFNENYVDSIIVNDGKRFKPVSLGYLCK